MTIRGVVAFGNISSWKGLYVHRGAQPSLLGAAVYRLWNAGLLTMDLLKKHPGGFTSFPDECFCHGPRVEQCGSCAKDSPYYVKSQPHMFFTHKNVDPLMINWVYVVEGCWLHVLGSYNTGFVRLKRGSAGLHRTLVYDYRVAAAVYMAAPQPDWRMVELQHLLIVESV